MHTEHCTDLRDHDVPRGHPAMQSINEPSRPVRVVKMVNRDVNRTVASRCARQRVQTQLFKSAQRLRFSPDPLVRSYLTVVNREQGLHRQHGTEHCRRRSDPAASSQILQAVDIKVRSGRGRTSAYLRCNLFRSSPGARHLGSGEHREADCHCQGHTVDNDDRNIYRRRCDLRGTTRA